MFRRPQSIEILILLISLACLFCVFITLDLERASPQPFPAAEAYAGIILITLFIVGQTFLRKTAFRAAALVMQCVALFMTLAALGGAHLIEKCLLVSLVVLQCSLRFTVTHGSVANAGILVCVALIGTGTGGGIEDRIYVLLYGFLWMLITEFIMYYREKLVEKSKALDLQNRSVENLVAANRAFVEHLEDVRGESADKERRRITRELHDTIGYAMTNMVMMMNASRHLIRENPGKVLDFCVKSRDLAATTLRETREILYKLRAAEQFKTDNPATFFIRLCKDFRDATGVETECHVGNLPNQINGQVFTALFRAVQVAFINALRHGSATRIRLLFWISEEELSMRVWNNTRLSAEDTEVVTKGIGLDGVCERLESLNGRLQLGTVVDGFELVVTIPREEVTRGLD